MPPHVHLHDLPTKSGSLIFCSSLVMSPGGGPPSESLDASRLPTLDGGGSTLTYVDWRPFNVSLIASKERQNER
jgi:hypothetical protein